MNFQVNLKENNIIIYKYKESNHGKKDYYSTF